MYTTSNFRNNLKLELDGEPYAITWFQSVNPGKGTAFTRTKLKSLITGLVIERTFRSGEKIKKPDLEEFRMQYLYRDDTGFVLMNTQNYEQVAISEEAVGDDSVFLVENTEVDVLFFNGRPVGIGFPNHMVFEIVECEPGIKGDTATGATKPATLETGLIVNVPLFVNQGDKIRVDTRTREYMERAN